MQINIFLSYPLKAVAPAKPFSLMPFIHNDRVYHLCMHIWTHCYIQMMKNFSSPLCDKACSTCKGVSVGM